MPDQKLPDRPIATSADDADLIHIVDVSDTTDSPQGTSKQITRGNAFSQYQKNNQTITLSGDATGSGTTSITVTVADNSHNHTIGNVTGLQAQLNLKANLTAITKALIDALGVNAATLDGLDSTDFLRSVASDYSGDLNNITIGGQHRITTGATNFPSGATTIGSTLINYTWDANAAKQVYYDYNTDRIFTRRKVNTWQPWVETWTSGTDGPGSGLDADTLDGLQGSQFLRSDVDDTMTGNFTATGTIQAPLFLEVSDERLKTKIKDLQPNHIPVKWKEFELKSNKGKKRYGVIAQELEKTNPELVHTNDDGFKAVNYIDFLCIKSAEQENEIEQLKILVKQLIDNGTTN